MPLPICALPRRPAGEADEHVVALVGLDPGAAFHVALAQHRAGPHRAVHLVAGAVEEAGVDERDAVRRRRNAGLQVDAGTALLVHDAEFDVAFGNPSNCSTRPNSPAANATSAGRASSV
jgi:hypothetical protein